MSRYRYLKTTGSLRQQVQAVNHEAFDKSEAIETSRLPAPSQALPQIAHNTSWDWGTRGPFRSTVREGRRVLVTHADGRQEVVVGPAQVWHWRKTLDGLQQYVAHPGHFLMVRHRDGTQEHLSGPTECWLDPRIHSSIELQEAVQLAAHEAVVVYNEQDATTERRIEYGPSSFVPGPGEWLHTFSWHGGGANKQPGGMVFQKLWLGPDQMYHDVQQVRTADDGVLTVNLMIFFELVDIDKMLAATHDPIGDFINAATSDVVNLVAGLSFDEFKASTTRLGALETYRNLVHRAEQSGYTINEVVYRGYTAPESLTEMHAQATESRIRLQLERATERQAQELQDLKQDRELARAEKERQLESAAVTHAMAMKEREAATERALRKAEAQLERGEARLDEEQRLALAAARQTRECEHLEALRAMGVDLTAVLTKGAPDEVIEVRGGGSPHLHLARPAK